MPFRSCVRLWCAAVVLVSGVSAAGRQAPAPARAAPRGPAREIIRIAPDLYRARNGNWYTIFLVTQAGIVLGDPINLEFARWLKGATRRALQGAGALRRLQPQSLRSRVRRRGVRRHGHVRGAREHAAQHGRPVPAHARRHVRPQRQRPYRPRGDQHPDQRRAGHLRPGPNSFAAMDRNNDGRIPPQELQADIRRPDIVYSDLDAHRPRRQDRGDHPSRPESFRRCQRACISRRNASCSRPSFWPMRWSRRRCGRCRAHAAPSTAARCRSGSDRTGRSRRWTSTCWRQGTATCSPRRDVIEARTSSRI